MKVKFELNVFYENEEKEIIRADNFADILEIADALLEDEEKFGFDRRSFGEIVFTLYTLVFAKSVQYGNSWQKRGEIRGPIANMDRKYDRIMTSIERWVEEGKNDPYPRIDGSADLAVYAILYLSTYLREHYPEVFEKWWTEEVQVFLDRYRPLRSVDKEATPIPPKVALA